MYSSYQTSDELADALAHANVDAMQISKGGFKAGLIQTCIDGWSLQRLAFQEGASICSGDGPSDRFAIILPVNLPQRCKLLGKQLGKNSIGLYAPGGEHADSTDAGYEQIVLMTPPDFDSILEAEGIVLPKRGSNVLEVCSEELRPLRRLLMTLSTPAMLDISNEEARRSMGQDIASATLAALKQDRVRMPIARFGRPRLDRATIFRKVVEVLHERHEEPIYARELAAELGISQPSLQRVFSDLFGLSPARYLALRRLYRARNRLSEGEASVTEIAYSLGFWDLSRFSKLYRDLFGEPPSCTLRKARQRRPTA